MTPSESIDDQDSGAPSRLHPQVVPPVSAAPDNREFALTAPTDPWAETVRLAQQASTAVTGLLSRRRPFTQYRNPEVRHVFGVISSRIAEITRLVRISGGPAPDRAQVLMLEAILGRDVARLSVDSAWDYATELHCALLEIADDAYFYAIIQQELSSQFNRYWPRLSEYLPDELLTRYSASSPVTALPPNERRQLIERLARLFHARSDYGRLRRAKSDTKAKYIRRLIWPLSLLLVVFSAALIGMSPANQLGTAGNLLLACSGGALGSALSGFYRFRDKLSSMTEQRVFWPTVITQMFVGASAGVFAYTLTTIGFVSLLPREIDPSRAVASIGLLAFLAGFSEPFFLGVVQRLAATPDHKSDDAEPETDPQNP